MLQKLLKNMPILNFNDFKDKHLGHRCFIIGSAPSLRQENLSLLKGEYVFLTNRSYLAVNDLNLPNYHYYVLTDLRNYVYDYAEIKSQVTATRFYPGGITTLNEYNMHPIEDFVPINKYGDTKKRKMLIKGLFPESYESGWGKSRTVVIDAAIIAYFMGFKEIYLLGVDLNFENKSDTHFYRMRIREEKNDLVPENAIETLLYLDKNLKDRSITFKNLSKGFAYKHTMDTDTLENVLSNKLHT